MADRVDANGTAYAGSQLQTQLYVNRRTAQLATAIRAELVELDEAEFEWRSPLAADGYAEYWDVGFLERVELGHHAAELKVFWPTREPHWDALAIVKLAGSAPLALYWRRARAPRPSSMASAARPSRIRCRERSSRSRSRGRSGASA